MKEIIRIIKKQTSANNKNESNLYNIIGHPKVLKLTRFNKTSKTDL
jgi:hypothetical protein